MHQLKIDDWKMPAVTIKKEVWKKIKKSFIFNQQNVCSYKLINRAINKLKSALAELFVGHAEADFFTVLCMLILIKCMKGKM